MSIIGSYLNTDKIVKGTQKEIKARREKRNLQKKGCFIPVKELVGCMSVSKEVKERVEEVFRNYMNHPAHKAQSFSYYECIKKCRDLWEQHFDEKADMTSVIYALIYVRELMDVPMDACVNINKLSDYALANWYQKELQWYFDKLKEGIEKKVRYNRFRKEWKGYKAWLWLKFGRSAPALSFRKFKEHV